MIKIEQIYIDGTRVQGIIIESPGGTGHPNMIIIQCRNGYLMCGYLNLDAAERFGDAAVVVSGADFDDILENSVKQVTPAAYKRGVKEGMTGQEALKLLNGESEK